MESDDSSKGKRKKNKGPKEHQDHTIKFKVLKPDDRCLKLIKPDDGESSVDICIAKEDKSNLHGMGLMFKLNHHSVLSMKALGPLDTHDKFLIFTEKCKDSLNKLIWRDSYTNIGHIPSLAFQRTVRGIIDGLDYLRKKNLYHGNLTWETTLYEAIDIHTYIPKLWNFKLQDGVDIVHAQWRDWDCLRIMLKAVSDNAAIINQNPRRHLTLFTGEVDALIDLIASSDSRMLLMIKDVLLGETFFWTRKERTKFMTIEVSDWIHNIAFKKKINDSNVVDLEWNEDTKNRSISDAQNFSFTNIVNHCNSYRTVKFDFEKQSDCVELACAAYTHEDEIKGGQGNVDLVFQSKFPRIFVELKRLVEEMVVSARSSQPQWSR